MVAVAISYVVPLITGEVMITVAVAGGAVATPLVDDETGRVVALLLVVVIDRGC